MSNKTIDAVKCFAVTLPLFFSCINSIAQQKKYFQQEVNYNIHVSLDDKHHMLNGDISIEYINQSPDVLDTIFIHLWPNAYKNNKTALARNLGRDKNFMLWYLPEAARGYIDSLNFKIDGQSATWKFYKDFEDIAFIIPEKKLQPGNSITITTPFRVKLPSGTISRLGHVGESYQITQWFPKPAVYDNDGWHAMPYLNQGEFYSEFGSFDVHITLPENYTVGSTGDLQTEGELKRLNELSYSNAKNEGNEFPPSSSQLKTLHYKQKNVHDFAWFADKRFAVRKGEIELPHSKRKVTTWAMFTPENADGWESHGLKSINDGVYYYSLWTGDYPYNQCTAIDGTISAGGGMEYPNVTVIGGTSNPFQLELVIIHEVGHNWFYGMLGSNERDNAWMDEGINSFFESRILEKLHPELNAGTGILEGDIGKITGINKFPYRYQEELMYLLTARLGNDQPMQAYSEDFTNMNYGGIVYKKTSLAFNYLMQYLGEDLFNKCMAEYFEKWKFKHPSPADLENVFETTSGKDLNWFFDELIKTDEKMNYKAFSTKKPERNSTRKGRWINVMNKGEIVSPFSVSVLRDDSIVSTQWFDGHTAFNAEKYFIDGVEKGDVLKINAAPGLPEYDRNNNTIRTKGLLRKIEKPSLQFMTGIDDPDRSQFFLLPLVAWNEYNHLMLGASLHNQTIPLRNFNWSISPLYSFSANNLNGFAKIEVDDGNVAAGMKTQKFAEYLRYYNVYEGFGMEEVLTERKAIHNYWLLHPYLKFNLFPNRLKKDWSGNFGIHAFVVNSMEQKAEGDVWHYGPYEYEYTVVRFRTDVRKKYILSNLRIGIMAESTGDETYGLQSELVYDYIYHTRSKAKLISRFYCGWSNGLYSVSGQNGGHDYAYENLFLGRSEGAGILSQQFVRNQGGLAAPWFYDSNGLVLSLNAEMDVPFKFPLALYGGMAWTYQGFADVGLNWNFGVTLPIARDYFQIYLPLFYSRDLHDIPFAETILFELNLDMMSPFELLRNLEP